MGNRTLSDDGVALGIAKRLHALEAEDWLAFMKRDCHPFSTFALKFDVKIAYSEAVIRLHKTILLVAVHKAYATKTEANLAEGLDRPHRLIVRPM